LGIDKQVVGTYYSPRFGKSGLMAPKYVKGQKVIITPVGSQDSVRSSDLEVYAGQTGRVTDYYWIGSNRGEVFYIYTVRIGTGDKEVVLHEDELEPYIE
jgi:hypothetical protein